MFKDVFLPPNMHVRLHDTIRSAQQLSLQVYTPAHENCFPFEYFIIYLDARGYAENISNV